MNACMSASKTYVRLAGFMYHYRPQKSSYQKNYSRTAFKRKKSKHTTLFNRQINSDENENIHLIGNYDPYFMKCVCLYQRHM